MSSTNWGFCDLAVANNFEAINIIETLGYSTIAINTFVEESGDEPKKKRRKGEVKEKQDAFPPPARIDYNQAKLKTLYRITIEFSDSSIAHKMNQSENLRKYDLIAVVPKTLAAFQYACGSMDIDIITFDPQTRIPFKVSRKLYRQAVDRGIFFELMYAPAIKDSSARKNIICTAHLYHAVGKSKNLIVTSNADNSQYIRGVYDVINLGFIFGLDSKQSLESVRNNARRVILKSEGRRSGKLYVSVKDDTEDNSKPNKDA